MFSSMGSGETHGKGSFAGGSRGSHNSPGGAERRRRRDRKEPIDPPRSVSFHVSFRIAKTSIICSSVTRLGAAVTWVLRAAHGVIPSPPPPQFQLELLPHRTQLHPKQRHTDRAPHARSASPRCGSQSTCVPKQTDPKHNPGRSASAPTRLHRIPVTPTSLPAPGGSRIAPHYNQTLFSLSMSPRPPPIRPGEDGQTHISSPLPDPIPTPPGRCWHRTVLPARNSSAPRAAFRSVPPEPRNSCISSRWIPTSGASDARREPRNGTVSPSGSFAKSWERDRFYFQPRISGVTQIGPEAMQSCTWPRCQPQTHLRHSHHARNALMAAKSPRTRHGTASNQNPQPPFCCLESSRLRSGRGFQKKKGKQKTPSLQGPGVKYSSQPNAFSSANVIVKVSLEALFIPLPSGSSWGG